VRILSFRVFSIRPFKKHSYFHISSNGYWAYFPCNQKVTPSANMTHDDKVIGVSAGQGQRKTKRGEIQELRSAREKLNNGREGLKLNAGRRPTEAVIKQRAHECHRASSQRRMRWGLGCLRGEVHRQTSGGRV
jgi:hypothetical protein